MHFDIAHSAGKARAQAVQNRRQAVLERPLRRRLRAVLDRTYALVAEHAVHGVFDVDHVVGGQRGVLMKVLSEHYTRVGHIFLVLVETGFAGRNDIPGARKTAGFGTDKPANRAVINNKAGKAIAMPASAGGNRVSAAETKGMAQEFWQAFHNWTRKQAADKVALIDAATRRDIRKTIRTRSDEGASYKEIADGIFDRAKGINGARALRIAHTEVHAASTYAVDAAVRSIRVKFEREWVSMNDDRVRPAFNAKPTKAEPWDHRRANGQRRAMDEPFDVSGEKLMVPGDPKGSAGNVIGCRCVVLYHAVRGAGVTWT